MAAPNTSLRPKARPKPQTERMLRPQTKTQVKKDLQQKQLAADFGDVEFRADLEPQFSWNPLARLGYNPKRAKVLPSSLLEPNNAYAIPDSSSVERITNASEFKRSDPLEVERINPGDVVTKGPTAVSPVWSHEFTHKGIERLKEYLDEDPEFFKEKYGEKTFNLINKVSKRGKAAKDANERVTEFFDYLEDTINVPGFTVSKKQIDKSLEIPEIKSETQKLLREKDFNKDGQISAMEFAQDTFFANSNLSTNREDFQKSLKSPDKKSYKRYIKSLYPGLVGAVQAAQDLLEAQGEVPKVKRKTLSFWEKVAKHFGYSRLGFNEGGDVSAQMQSLMVPSADSDPAPPRKDNFTAASFAEDSWEDTKKRFMDAGRIDVNPEDPAIFTAYKRALDYLKDTGLAGLGLADTAFKYAVGSVAQVMPTEALEKRMARDLYSIPEAFAGAAGARSLTQLDDAADAFLEGSLQVARKASEIKPDPNTLASFVGAVPPTYIKREAPIKKKLKDYGFRTDNPATKGYDDGEEWLKNKQKRAEESGDPTLLRGAITGYLGRESNPLFINTNALLELKGASGEKRYPGESRYDLLRARVEERGFDPEQKYSPDDEYGNSVLVGVNHKGEAFIIEGNTRVAVANDLNVPSLRVEVRYFNGAENVKGPYSPENIINRSSGLLDQAKKDAKDKEAFSDYLDLRNMGILQFREPISEFIETLTIPKKGMLGSEFLNQIKKNPSIPETSLQEGIIDPSKRYTKEELLGAIGVGRNTQGTFKSTATISPYKIKQFEGNQRQQKDAGFQGGNEIEYFDIPVDTTIGYPGKPFRASSQHYNPETLVHVRGSIVNPRGRVFYPREIKEFDKIIGGKNYLLAEEIQSDLLTKGYAKPNNFFDAIFSEATKNWTASNLITYQEAYGDIDKEIKKVLKLLDDPSSAHLSPGRVSSNPKFYNFSSEYTDKINFENRMEGLKGIASFDRIDYDELSDLLIKTSATEKDIDQVFETLKADALLEPILLRKSAIDSMWENDPEAAVFLERGLDTENNRDVDFLTHDELVNLPEVNSILDEGIKEDFLNYHNKRQQALDSATEEYLNFLQSQIDKLKINDTIDAKDLAELHENMIMAQSYTPDTSEIGLPPIRKNKQAVDEALKVLIAKAAQSGVNKIVIPPAEKIAEARGRVLKKDKGDRFYRTYVTDLNKSLEELEANYPVTIYKDVELPYESKIFKPEGTNKKVFNVISKGTIIDISELVNRFKVEQPRQFAQGGVAMNEQMEMAFMQQGGLKDDGMNQDPVSGNEVPSGSMASEVRDDIPAQLSEGEYVVPADVVRYFGVKHFEDLRNKAKGGLNKMEADGRIGGEPVPVGGPKADLRPDEVQEIQKMFEGGMVSGAAEGADFSFYNPEGSTTEEAITTPTRYTGEFSFEQPKTESPPPVVGEPVQSENNIVTLYGPNGEVLSLMLPRDQAMYDQLISQGYTLEVRQGQSESKDSDPEVPTTDPNAWMDKYDYTNSDVLMQQSLDALDPKEGFAGVVGKVFGGGIFGQLSSASNAAQIAANIRLLNSQGVDTKELQAKLDTYIKTNNIGWMPKSWIDGDQLEGDVREQIGDDLFSQPTTIQSDTNKSKPPKIKPSSGPSTTLGVKPAAAKAPTATTGGGMTGSDTRPDDPRGEGQYGGVSTSRKPRDPVKDLSLEKRQEAARKSREASLPGPRKSDIPSSIRNRVDPVSESLKDKSESKPTFDNKVEYDADMYNKGGLMKKKKKNKK